MSETVMNGITGATANGEHGGRAADGNGGEPRVIISLRDLCKSFGDKVVLDHASLDFYEGETHVILGRSGEGKSVLVKHICGLLKPDAGEVWFEDVRIDTGEKKAVEKMRDNVQMLFQSGAIFDSMTVAENIGFHAVEHGHIGRGDVMEFARRWLELIDMAEAGPMMPAELSGGMRKRVGLARAVAVEPKVLLYDEPTTGLDPLTSNVISELICAMQKKLGVTSIVITHDIASARIVADRVSFLMDGKIVATGTYEELQKSEIDVVRSFFQTAKKV